MASFFQKNKRMILAVILIGLIAAPLALVPVEGVRAQGVPGGSGGYTMPTSYQATLDSAPPVEVDKCKLTNPSSWGKCILDGWRFVIEWTTINFLNWLVGLTGGLLDFFIKFSLNSSFFKDNLAISNAWKLIRDLVNMGFIFIMLYIAISTILQLSSYNIKSMLVKLIIAAVFINFSLFITKVVMDAGNIVALNFYNALSVPVLVDGNTVNQPNIGKTFQNYLGIQDKYDPRTGEKVDLDSVSAFFNTVMRAITQIIVIYVFLSLVFVFIARVIAFIFLMIFSPIGFIGAVFPGASGAAAKWRKTLIDQTLVAPVFLILIYLVVQIIESGIFNISPPDFSDPNGAVTVDAAFYFNYIIIIGLLIMTKKITKDLGGEMGKMVESFGKKALAVAGGAALAVATGGTALAGRAAIGAAASRVAASGSLKNLAATTGTGLGASLKRFAGHTGIQASSKIAGASFEARNVGMFQKAAGLAGIKVAKTKTGEGGYKAVQERKTEKAREFAEKLAPSEAEKQRKQENYLAAKAEKDNLEKQAEENIKKSGAPGSVELHKQSEMIRLAGGPDKFNQMNQEVAKRKAEFDFVDTTGGKVSEREKQYAQQLKQPGVAGGGPTVGAEREISNAADTLSEKIKEAMTEAGGNAADKMAKAMGIGVNDLKKKLDEAMAALNNVRPGAITNPELRNSVFDNLEDKIQSLAPAFSTISNESAQQVSSSVAQIKQNLVNAKQPSTKEYIVQKVSWTPQWKREAADKIIAGEKLKKKKGGKDKKKFLEDLAELLDEEMSGPTPPEKPPTPPPTPPTTT